MSKDPAFLFYPNDYLGGTMGFSVDQHGLYILALIFQFNNGHFTEIQINAILNNRFSEIKHKFQTDGKTFWNDRLDSEKEKRCKYVESRKNNGRSFLFKKDNPLINKHIDIKHMGIPSGTHMENENEDENRNGICINSEEKMQEEKPKTWRTDYEIYLKECGDAFDRFVADLPWIEEKKRYYPFTSIRKSLEKMYNEYWGTDAGWMKKKSNTKLKSINWQRTLENGLSMAGNRVRIPKGTPDFEQEEIEKRNREQPQTV